MPANTFLRTAPEAQGVDSQAILDFLTAIEQRVHDVHSFMLLRHGAVVAEGWWKPYAPERPHMLFSLSKSFTSTAIGLAISAGLLSLDDTVLSFFPEEAPEQVGPNLAAMRIRHLLTMSTGQQQDPFWEVSARQDGNWVRGFLHYPAPHRPGSLFVYNSTATYMLSAILQKVSGVTLLEYLRPRLLVPLGIQGASWETDPRGINVGGMGLSIRTEDIARFGQLYLQNGVWNGQRLVPAAWVRKATSFQIANGDAPDSDWAQGYGFQFWMCRHGAYRGDGAFGQYCLVMPAQDAVLAITGGLPDMQVPLDIVWDTLLPGMRASAWAGNSAAQGELAARLQSLHYDPPGYREFSPREEWPDRVYALEPNAYGLDSLNIDWGPTSACLHFRRGRSDGVVTCGYGRWIEGRSQFFSPEPQAAAASLTWRDAQTAELTFRLVETPFVRTARFTFEGERVHVHVETNVGFEPNVPLDIEGHSR